jgi:hypothetical protein
MKKIPKPEEQEGMPQHQQSVDEMHTYRYIFHWIDLFRYIHLFRYVGSAFLYGYCRFQLVASRHKFADTLL